MNKETGVHELLMAAPLTKQQKLLDCACAYCPLAVWTESWEIKAHCSKLKKIVWDEQNSVPTVSLCSARDEALDARAEDAKKKADPTYKGGDVSGKIDGRNIFAVIAAANAGKTKVVPDDKNACKTCADAVWYRAGTTLNLFCSKTNEPAAGAREKLWAAERHGPGITRCSAKDEALAARLEREKAEQALSI